jgi:hypothetical protein
MSGYVRGIFARTVLTLVVVVFASCASTELSSAWRNPDYKGSALKKLLVVGVSKQPAVRRAFEDEFVKQLKASGVGAVASYTLIPELGPAEQARLRQGIEQAGADAMLITRLVRIDVDTQFTPAFHPTAGTDLAGGYSAAWTGYHEPAGASQPETAILETNLYGVNESQLLWSGTTQTFAPAGDLQKDIQGFAKLVIGALEKLRLI